MHQLKNEINKTFGIACNPLLGIYHFFETETNQGLSTGQPIVVYADTKAEAYDLLFSAWTEDENGNLDTYTPHDISVSIDYTEADALQTAADAMEIIGGLMIRPIKHPSRDEWAIIVSPQVLAKATAGAKRDALLSKHAAKVSQGKNKTKAEVIADDWL